MVEAVGTQARDPQGVIQPSQATHNNPGRQGDTRNKDMDNPQPR